MKKAISILLVLLVIVCGIGSTLAEDFTLHSGVSFGMTLEEIKKIEEDAGFSTDIPDNNAYLQVYGKIASIENSAINYYFDNNKMNIAKYRFGKDSTDRGSNEYSLIQESLNNRYGSASGLPDGFHTKQFNEDMKNIVGDGITTNDGTITRDEGWLIPQENGYIAIEHYTFYYQFTQSFLNAGMIDFYPEGKAFYHMISYEWYDADDPAIANALNTVQENISQLNNDL